MSTTVRRSRLPEELVRRLAAAIRSAQLYAPGHPLVERSLVACGHTLTQLLADEPTVTLGLLEDEIVVGDAPLPGADSYRDLIRRLQAMGIERIAFSRGVIPADLETFVLSLAHPERAPGERAPGAAAVDLTSVWRGLRHIDVGRLRVEERTAATADMATIRRLYADAVNVAGRLWEGAQLDGHPDPEDARELVDDLAQAVAQNRTALVALTALKAYDNYTFTHMVNVSILTMAQARAVGVDPDVLREFGLAALMHDIGKVRTPVEILNKPDELTDQEFAIMRMHVVDGAEILRQTPDIPPLAPVVAFEHHLRLDGSGYPLGIQRDTLNLATMLCSIADVYDAMRSRRVYQESFPTDRILGVLKRNDGSHFDQHLVRRFTQLMGIYPPGNLVRLDGGALAVVLHVHAPDPHRPTVRVLTDEHDRMLSQPYDVNLWEADSHLTGPRMVMGPVDPAVAGIDPLVYLP